MTSKTKSRDVPEDARTLLHLFSNERDARSSLDYKHSTMDQYFDTLDLVGNHQQKPGQPGHAGLKLVPEVAVPQLTDSGFVYDCEEDEDAFRVDLDDRDGDVPLEAEEPTIDEYRRSSFYDRI